MESKPNRRLLFISFILTPIPSVLLTCLIFGLILPVYERITGREIPRSVEMPILVIIFVVILFFFIRFMLKNSNGYYVTIDDKNIYFGRKKEITLPFNEIAAGLPERMTSAINLNKYLNRRSWLGLVAQRKRALLVINRDGSIIQFNIHSNKNGTSLMGEFAHRNNNKMIVDYTYDAKQIEILKWPRWNKICRSFEIEKAFGDVKTKLL